jgi:hypothetical protein
MSSSTLPITLPPFDGSRLSFSTWQQTLLDTAQRASQRPHGLLGYLLTPAEYALLPGGPVHVPLADPGVMPIVAAPFAIWSFQTTQLQREDAAVAALTQAILQALPPSAQLLLMDGNNGVRGRTLAWIYATLTATFGVATAAELEDAFDSLTLPFVSGTFDTYVFHHRRVHRMFDVSTFPLTEPIKVLMLVKAVRSVPAYQAHLLQYFAAHPLVREQTFEALATVLERVRVDASTVAAHAYAGATVTVQPSHPRVAKSYCWTHGSTAHHTSSECLKRAPGHQATATASNKQGGRA